MFHVKRCVQSHHDGTSKLPGYLGILLPFRERWSTQLDVRTSGQWGHFRTGSQVSRRINANVPSVWKPTPARALTHIPKPPPAAPCHVPPTAAGLQRCTIRKVLVYRGHWPSRRRLPAQRRDRGHRARPPVKPPDGLRMSTSLRTISRSWTDTAVDSWAPTVDG